MPLYRGRRTNLSVIDEKFNYVNNVLRGQINFDEVALYIVDDYKFPFESFQFEYNMRKLQAFKKSCEILQNDKKKLWTARN